MCFDTHYVVSQCLIVSVRTDICKRSVEIYLIDLDLNVNLLLNIGLKKLFPKLTVSTELRWVVFGCCCVVL